MGRAKASWELEQLCQGWLRQCLGKAFGIKPVGGGRSRILVSEDQNEL